MWQLNHHQDNTQNWKQKWSTSPASFPSNLVSTAPATSMPLALWMAAMAALPTSEAAPFTTTCFSLTDEPRISKPAINLHNSILEGFFLTFWHHLGKGKTSWTPNFHSKHSWVAYSGSSANGMILGWSRWPNNDSIWDAPLEIKSW